MNIWKQYCTRVGFHTLGQSICITLDTAVLYSDPIKNETWFWEPRSSNKSRLIYNHSRWPTRGLCVSVSTTPGSSRLDAYIHNGFCLWLQKLSHWTRSNKCHLMSSYQHARSQHYYKGYWPWSARNWAPFIQW